jgi:Phage integrase family.
MTWDKNIEYDIFLAKLIKHYRKAKGKSKCYLSISILQLTNGLRARESISAFKRFIETGERKFNIKVLKQKKDKLRPVKIPDVIENQDRVECEEFLNIDDMTIRDRYRAWLYKYFKVNTHSLRYAFVTKMVELGLNPVVISQITGHSELKYLLTYTHKHLGEKALEYLNL